MIRIASLCSFALLALLWTGCPSSQLVGGACNASNCPGCCDAHGACQTGTSTPVCGHGGAACQACSGGAACTAQGTCGSVATCTPQNCNGCCAPNGSCIAPSNTIFACGSSGGACQVCSGQQACSNGNCVNTGTCSGCLDINGNCQVGTSTSNCGANGAECSLCSTGQSCTNGQCTSPCNASTCSNGCCNGNTCVLYASQNNSECGSGGVACGTCTNGHTCNGSGQCSGGGSCSAATCPSGCCNGNACVPYASENNNQCGTGGAACAACGTGQSCNGSGVCASGGCSASSCPSGCCNGATCVPYTSENNNQCGTGGASCSACITGQTCNGAGVCTGGGTVTGTGGSVPSLFFAVVGDTRPGTNEDCASYPTSVITKIYQNLEAMNPKPQFILTTGDYQYCSPGATCTTAPVGQPCAQTQIGFYAQAQTTWTGGPVFSSMGNHECNGFTASNMTFSGSDYSQGSCDGTASDNYSQWFSKLVAPLGQTKPYYSVPINATDGSWTSKFINVACNAWDSTQQSWLQSALAQPTTYTFVFRHEDPGTPTGPCVSTVDSMLTTANHTMLIFGHSHSFQASPPKNLLVGNGGAGSGPFGYATVQQQGTHFLVTQYDYSSGSAVGTTTY